MRLLMDRELGYFAQPFHEWKITGVDSFVVHFVLLEKGISMLNGDQTKSQGSCIAMGFLCALQPFNQVVDWSQKSAKVLPGMLLQQLLLHNQNVMHGFCIYGGLADCREECRTCKYEMCYQGERFKEMFTNETLVRYERTMSWRTKKLHKVKDNYWHANDHEDVSEDNQDGDHSEGGNKPSEEESIDEDDIDEHNWNVDDGGDDGSYNYDANENNQDGEDDDKQYSGGDGDDDPDEDDDKDYGFEEDDDQDEEEDEDEDKDKEDGYEAEDYGNDAEREGPISHGELHGTAVQLKLNLGFKTATESKSDNTEEESREDDHEDNLESPDSQNWHAEIYDQEFEAFENNDENLWNKEFQKYLDQKPEFRARLQYQVRCILIVPAFEAGGCNESAFEQFYVKKFRRGIKATGFSTAARLCRAMPHVVQRRLLDEERKLYLVESTKNFRVVAGIRSGLRRVVYDIVKSHSHGLLVREFIYECSRVIGRPLATVLTELAYGTSNVDSMIRDMLDIICLRDHGSENSKLFLCRGAEDPALTDGILLGGTWNGCLTHRKRNSYLDANDLEQCQSAKAANAEVKMLDGSEKQISAVSLEGSGDVPDGCLEHIIAKYNAASSNLDDKNLDGSDIRLPFSEDESFLQARFKLRVLLAVCTSGIELSKLEEAYEKMFSLKLNLDILGYSSIIDLANSWQDIILLSDIKPEWAYLLPSKDNMRILQTLKSDLRLTIFSFLLASYPEGMDSCKFLGVLQQSLSDDLWDTFVAHGYITDAARKPLNYSFISKNEDFHVTHFAEFCLMLHDMVDFICLGCRDDGCLIIKLRDTNFPVLDFPEESLNIECDQNIQLHEHSDEGQKTNNSEDLTTKSGLEHGTRLQNVSLAKSESFPSPTLKHQVRLILGSPKYNECALSLYEFCAIFMERTGNNIHVNDYKELKSLMDAMPDVVSRDSLRAGRLKLSKTCQNQRIISATKAGLRQILYWALLKNSGGLWVELLEGWYSDFAGSSLGLTLYQHGYRGSRKGLVSPVFTFLEDMVDLTNKCKINTLDMYSLAGMVDDPLPADALLLGLSSVDIQYDPLRDVFGFAYTNGDNNKLQSTHGDVGDANTQRGTSTLRGGYEADTEGEKVLERTGNSNSTLVAMVPSITEVTMVSCTPKLDFVDDSAKNCTKNNFNHPHGNKLDKIEPLKFRSYEAEQLKYEDLSPTNYQNVGLAKDDRKMASVEGQLQPIRVKNVR